MAIEPHIPVIKRVIVGVGLAATTKPSRRQANAARFPAKWGVDYIYIYRLWDEDHALAHI